MITSKDTILYLNYFFLHSRALLYDAFIFCQRDNQKNNLFVLSNVHEHKTVMFPGSSVHYFLHVMDENYRNYNLFTLRSFYNLVELNLNDSK